MNIFDQKKYGLSNSTPRRSRSKKIVFGVVIVLVIVLLWQGFLPDLLRTVGFKVAGPVWSVKDNLISAVPNPLGFFKSKSALLEQVKELEEEVLRLRNQDLAYRLLLRENENLRMTLGVGVEKKQKIVGSVVSGLQASPYHSIVIDIGSKDDVVIGDRIYAEGGVAIGEVSLVASNNSQVSLYSAPGNKVAVILEGELEDTTVEAVGVGSQNFSLQLPKGVEIEEGQVLSLPGSVPVPLAVVGRVVDEPNDPFIRVLATSVANLNHVRHLYVEKELF